MSVIRVDFATSKRYTSAFGSTAWDKIGTWMSLKLVGSNAVVVAHQFNPSVVSQLWLVRNGILQEDDFLPGCVFTDVAVQIVSREFSLTVAPQQCQFTPNVSADQAHALVSDRLGTLVRRLPHTPYNAVGLNFIWHLIPDNADVSAVSRDLFFRAGRPPFSDFDVEDARFGAYMSKQAMDGRLRLDVRPVRFSEQEREEQEGIQFAFNFHRDVSDEVNAADCVGRTLERWNEALEIAERIVHTVQEES
ncbi:MAG: hypothetical protein ACYC6Y_25755 [Thermoguttaceae bacterium]